MTQVQHTPGPWSIKKRGDEVSIIGRPEWGCKYFGAKGRWSVAMMDETIADAYPREAEANARLIAAAPKLLEALEKAIKWLAVTDDPRCRSDEEAARAAIAKARGAA